VCRKATTKGAPCGGDDQENACVQVGQVFNLSRNKSVVLVFGTQTVADVSTLKRGLVVRLYRVDNRLPARATQFQVKVAADLK